MTKRVLIVTVPRQDVIRPPGILAILGACCEQVNADYDVFDLNLHMYKTLCEDQVDQLNTDFTYNNFETEQNQSLYTQVCQGLVNKIAEYQPDFVAISVFTKESVLATKHVLDVLDQQLNRKNYKIVIGGLGVSDIVSHITGPSTFGNWSLENNLVEYCITGEGEFAFPALLEGNLTHPGINGIPNIQITDLDTVPTPSYKRVNPADYFYSDSPEILVTGSKGCVRNCSFCDIGYYWKRYVFRSGDKIADDMYKIYKDTGVNKFNFSDSLINGSLKSFRQLNKRLIELRAQDPNFQPQYNGQFICRPIGQMKEQDYIDMKLAGAETLIVGIEHFSKPVRTHMRKHFDNSAIDWHFEKCAELGIRNVLLIISGYITETLDDHKLNIEYLHRYRRYALTRIISTISINIGGLTIDHTSPLYLQKEELGIHLAENDFDGTQWTSTINPDLTPTERLRRAVEILYVSGKLNYNVDRFSQKVSDLRRKFREMQNNPPRKQIPIYIEK